MRLDRRKAFNTVLYFLSLLLNLTITETFLHFLIFTHTQVVVFICYVDLDTVLDTHYSLYSNNPPHIPHTHPKPSQVSFLKPFQRLGFISGFPYGVQKITFGLNHTHKHVGLRMHTHTCIKLKLLCLMQLITIN